MCWNCIFLAALSSANCTNGHGKNKKPKHIAVAGNIGAGKTTLTELLSKHYKWIPQFEDVDHNPYLNDFYEDMPRWSFNLQIYFLNSRLTQLLEIHRGTETVIQDRTIYEDANIFAPNLHEMGLMSKRDFDNYFQFFPDAEDDGATAGPADLSEGIGSHPGGPDTKTRAGNTKKISAGLFKTPE